MGNPLPRPYAEEPPAVTPPSGVRLLRARPWGVLAALVATGAIVATYPAVTDALLNSRVVNRSPFGVLLLLPAFALLVALSTAASLTAVAILVRRRVTVGRALGLLAGSALVLGAQSALLAFLPLDPPLGGEPPWLVLSAGFDAVTLAVTGLLGIAVFPPVTGRDSVPALLAGSLVTAVAGTVLSRSGAVAGQTSGWMWAAEAVFSVGWAIAVLVTSGPNTAQPVVTPAELGHQDR